MELMLWQIGESLAETVCEKILAEFGQLKGLSQMLFRTHPAEDFDVQFVVWSGLDIHVADKITITCKRCGPRFNGHYA
jgi:hypothetical protein